MRMLRNELCRDIGYLSINHIGEQLCGDHVDVVEQDNGVVIVLADGLGSGVKANILSTLTGKIISTMLSQGMKIEEAVETIMATLPVCQIRGVAYSTFTIIRIYNNDIAEIYQYDNPRVIMFRAGEKYDYPTTELLIGGKKVLRSDIKLMRDDIIIAFSDGVEHAGVGNHYNFGWTREDIIGYIKPFLAANYTAKTLTTILLEEVERLYDAKPMDDATVCTIKIRDRVPMNLLFGPPQNRDDTKRMMSLFFAKEGKHIVCGGTTSTICANYLGKPLVPSLDFFDPDIPPTATIEGVDLVTEGVITINRVLEYAKNYLEDNKSYEDWSYKQDGASKIARLLFEEATDINFFVGRAINPAHQNPNLPINFSIKMRLVDELTECLEKMGKKVKVVYF